MRAAWGVLATAVAILAANWAIVASWLGRYLGLLPWESMLRLGPELGTLLVRLSNSPGDLTWLAAALLAAAVASR